jgi:hypothetical protein
MACVGGIFAGSKQLRSNEVLRSMLSSLVD